MADKNAPSTNAQPTGFLGRFRAQSDKLTLREKIGYACQDGAMELYTQFFNLYLMVFYTNVAGIPPALAGTLVMVCTIWNAVNDPIVGLLVDNFRSKNGEKLRPILKWATIPTVLFVIILFWMPEMQPGAAFVYALVMYCVMESFATFLGIPYISLPSVLTSKAEERVSLSLFAALGACIGPIIASTCTVLLMRGFGGVDAMGNVLDQRAGFRGAVIVVMVVFGLCQYIMYAVARERVRPQSSEKQRVGAVKAFKILITERNIMSIVGYNIFYSIALGAMLNTVVYYCNYILITPGGEAILSPILILVALAILPVVRLVNKRIKRRGLLICASIAMMVSRISLIIAPTSLAAACVTAAFMGIAMGFSVVSISTNISESIEILEWRRGLRLEGSVQAIRGLLIKIALAALAFSLGLAMDIAGYVAPTAEILAPVQNAATVQVFQVFFIYLPVVLGAFMLLMAFFSPTDRDAAQMRKEKAEKDEKDAVVESQ